MSSMEEDDNYNVERTCDTRKTKPYVQSDNLSWCESKRRDFTWVFTATLTNSPTKHPELRVLHCVASKVFVVLWPFATRCTQRLVKFQKHALGYDMDGCLRTLRNGSRYGKGWFCDRSFQDFPSTGKQKMTPHTNSIDVTNDGLFDFDFN